MRPSGRRNAASVSASHGPATAAHQSRSVCEAASSPERLAPARSRMASPNDRPSAAARRSIASNRLSVRLSRSWSISTHWPRINASPSPCASKRLISAFVSASPSSVTSMQKSSSASSPSCAGALAPTVAFTCARAGRFIRQFAGIRTTTPAASSAGTSLRNCSASCGPQRNGWKTSRASTMALSHWQRSAARWTGISSDSRRARFVAPA